MTEINQEGHGLTDEPISFKELRRKALCQALKRNRGNRTRAARELDLSIRTIRNWIREFGIPQAFGQPSPQLELEDFIKAAPA